MLKNELLKLQVLRAVEGEGRTIEWFEGMLPSDQGGRGEERDTITRELADTGFTEKCEGYRREWAPEPHPYRLTDSGRALLEELKERLRRT